MIALVFGGKEYSFEQLKNHLGDRRLCSNEGVELNVREWLGNVKGRFPPQRNN